MFLKISVNNVLEVLGDYSYDTMFELTNAIIDDDKSKIINIIETILKCYVEFDVSNENGLKINPPFGQSNEVKFLIEELKSFIDGIKK